jgi:predicted metal-dependent peptidase
MAGQLNIDSAADDISITKFAFESVDLMRNAGSAYSFTHEMITDRDLVPAHRLRSGGGTDYKCIADFCNKPENKNRWNKVVIFTDGYAPKMGTLDNLQVHWVISKHGTVDCATRGDLVLKLGTHEDFVLCKRM